ncbi:MAG TPA: DUF1028 domain-containing protein [Acidimicrobiales bacterium]|nr:DUF1028 domain-containing protein [Acidimicrobiales bacterium]
MTYSIVARDPESGQFGVAVQTCWFSVGAIVPWAIAGVGAVATQAMVELAYGPRCLDKLVTGADARRSLDAVRAGDEASGLRQVAVVDGGGGVSAFTGDLCIDFAGHQTGDGYSVQANMMASADVWPAMADAFETGKGPFPERLLGVLRAGERAGGDARGRMSAAILIVKADRQDHPWEGRVVDIRVDHHDQPSTNSHAFSSWPMPSSGSSVARTLSSPAIPPVRCARWSPLSAVYPVTRTPASCGPGP